MLLLGQGQIGIANELQLALGHGVLHLGIDLSTGQGGLTCNFGRVVIPGEVKACGLCSGGGHGQSGNDGEAVGVFHDSSFGYIGPAVLADIVGRLQVHESYFRTI
ncbi:hypothetical protein SDC9_166048 [bioreactor metagenome]|uniref:Uncharacterized protein n=1 Tax=bioreactor metagenome TaxID=1076179 RepID=A0A645FW64_9ZZZZ